MCIRLDGIKVMSPGISGGKQVIKFANTCNCGGVCLFSQNERMMLVMQNVQLKFRLVLLHCCAL